ncbi:hypothetical protein K435DRAFT_849745 [Dendrothele bispora CBS 962.96]|uniref:Uncharacterized protein n=1 Tax=Dendrothele bispora (strain CBS 962.96) TaxID=1314807 RepID=A0A4S8MS18_DENBC|nr:hypothetical protein K435DRAFT_849745 [Dendrothele bispora CBS 962.96]
MNIEVFTSLVNLLSSSLSVFSNVTAIVASLAIAIIVASLAIAIIVALYLLILSYFPCLTVNKLDHMMLKLKETVEYCHENEIRLSLPEDDPEAYIKVRQKYSRIRMRNNILQSTFFTICIWTYIEARVKIVKSIVECYWDASALNASLQVPSS